MSSRNPLRHVIPILLGILTVAVLLAVLPRADPGQAQVVCRGPDNMEAECTDEDSVNGARTEDSVRVFNAIIAPSLALAGGASVAVATYLVLRPRPRRPSQ